MHRPWKKKVFKEITFRFWGPVPFQERTVTLRGCVFLFYFGFNFQTAPCSGASSSSFSVYSISPHHTFWEKKWLFGIPVKYSKIICVLRGNTWSAHEFDQQKQKKSHERSLGQGNLDNVTIRVHISNKDRWCWYIFTYMLHPSLKNVTHSHPSITIPSIGIPFFYHHFSAPRACGSHFCSTKNSTTENWPFLKSDGRWIERGAKMELYVCVTRELALERTEDKLEGVKGTKSTWVLFFTHYVCWLYRQFLVQKRLPDDFCVGVFLTFQWQQKKHPKNNPEEHEGFLALIPKTGRIW